MLVLVCGDRKWTDSNFIRKTLLDLKLSLWNDKGEHITILQGGAKGADLIAGQWGKDEHLEVIEVPAEWDLYGKRAGPIRNNEMLKMNPDLVIAFHNNIESSKGTKDMVYKARKAGIKTIIYSN